VRPPSGAYPHLAAEAERPLSRCPFKRPQNPGASPATIGYNHSTMADDEALARTITDYLTREYEDALQGTPVGPDTPLISSGLIDSLSMVSLKVFLEQTYKLRIPDREASAESFDSVSALVRMLRQLGVA
jgi:acyl carrier protein